MTTKRNGICNSFRIPDLIIKKRDGRQLRREEIEYFIHEVVEGSVQDAQLGAMLMAMFLRGLNDEETMFLTRAMTESGEVLSWPAEWKGLVVDKHSTGGVGDKVSLLLAPALAACGVKVPMVSGRGLGHTGGTLDKLESIPGFNVSLSHKEMSSVLDNVGCCIVGQTSNLVPADKIMYAIRDVTGTTDNIGLIASSIISKKMAEMLDTLVLDVKVGNGAFLATEKDARELATRMVKAGKGMGVDTVAILTSMDSPIGMMVGNALEVAESIQCLHGDGPGDLVDLAVRLGGQLLRRCGKAPGMQEAHNMIGKALTDGSALASFCEMLKAQGVDHCVADELCKKGKDVFDVLPKAKHVTEIKSAETGFVHEIHAMKCAVVSAKLGAGRKKAGDAVNFAVGLELCTAIGKQINEGDVWVKVHHDVEELEPELIKMLEEAFAVRAETPISCCGSRIIDVIT